MADELNQAEVDEAAPEPEVSPEPAVESEPEDEFNYEPEFLTESRERDPAPQQQTYEQQWSPEQVAAYNYQQRQMQQQAPSQHEGTLDRLVRNPDGTISEIAGTAAQHAMNQMMQQYVMPQNQQMQQFIRGQANYQDATTAETIKGMYKTKFNKDETFASSERVRSRVDSAISSLREQARHRAMMGDPTGFAIFNNPTFAQGVLALAKIMEGHTPTAAEAAAAVPHVERAAPAASQQEVVLDPDTEAAISKYGPGFRERYIQGLKDAEKFNDFQG